MTTDSRGQGDDETPGTPQWVKVFGIIALIVVVLFIILMFVRGPGGHGPARHFGSHAQPERHL